MYYIYAYIILYKINKLSHLNPLVPDAHYYQRQDELFLFQTQKLEVIYS